MRFGFGRYRIQRMAETGDPSLRNLSSNVPNFKKEKFKWKTEIFNIFYNDQRKRQIYKNVMVQFFFLILKIDK